MNNWFERHTLPITSRSFIIIFLSVASIFGKTTIAGELDCGIVDTSDGLTWDYFDPENHKSTN